MSSLRSIDLEEVDDLVDFIRGRGYVLNFSDSTYSGFFASEVGIDIDNRRYADMGGSKGKRLRRFLQLSDDQTALKALKALWEHRAVHLRRAGEGDPVPNAETRYRALLERLGETPPLKETGAKPKAKHGFDLDRLAALKSELVRITGLNPQPRGYAFEIFLKGLFDAYGMEAHQAFRNRGEQIDGSFVLEGAIYLLEAKWQNTQTGVGELRAFEGKLQDKAGWARGFFISQSGFTDDGLAAFGRGKRTICMDGLDLYETLDRGLPFDEVVFRKVRNAGETGHPFVRVRDLF